LIHFDTFCISQSDFMGKDFKHFLVLNAQVSHGDTRGCKVEPFADQLKTHTKFCSLNISEGFSKGMCATPPAMLTPPIGWLAPEGFRGTEPTCTHMKTPLSCKWHTQWGKARTKNTARHQELI